MKKILFLLTLILIPSMVFAVPLKYGGIYDIFDVIDGGGGAEITGGVYASDSSYYTFVSTFAGGINTVDSGWLPCLNNSPTVSLLAPLTASVTDYQKPTFRWVHTDLDTDPQSGFQLDLAADTNFSDIRYTSGNMGSSNKWWAPSSNMNEGKYYWRVRARDAYGWGDYTTQNFMIYIDTSAPNIGLVDSLTPYISSMTVAVSATDTSPLDFRISYSTFSVFTPFGTEVSTTSAWFYGPVAASTKTFLPLIPNTTYYFRSQARDRVNPLSSWSSIVPEITLCNPLSTALTFPLISSGSIQVAWSLDTNPGNTKFIVRASSTNVFTGSNGSVLYSTVTAQTMTNFSGLNTNTTYYFEIKAVNHKNISTIWRALGRKATMAAPPGNLSWGTITNTSMQIVFGSSNPDNPNNTIYKVELATAPSFSGSMYKSSQTTRGSGNATIAGLAVNTTYYARVTALNRVGVTSTTNLTPAWRSTLPTAPANLAWGTITNTSMKIAFGTSSPDNPANTIYRIHIATSSNFNPIISSSQTVRGTKTGVQRSTVTLSGLSPNVRYYARVVAVSRDGAFVVTALSAPAWHSTLVSPPQGQAWYPQRNDTFLRVDWGNSTPDNNPENTLYTVQMSSSSNFNPIQSSSQTTHSARYAVVSDLIITTTYYARVIATNWDGVSSTANVSGVMTTLNTGPGNVAWSSFDATAIRVTWGVSAPQDNPGDTPYRLVLSSVPSFAVVHSSLTIRGPVGGYGATISGLRPNTTYYAKVAAIWSGQYSTTTVTGWKATRVSTPMAVAWGTVNNDNILVTWGASSPENPSNTRYTIQMATNTNFTGTLKTTQTTYGVGQAIVGNLVPNTTYYGRILASNWQGLISTVAVSGGTPRVTKVSPPAVAWGTITTNSITVNFNASSPDNPGKTGYVLQISTNSVFEGTIHSSQTTRGSNNATVMDLMANTTYFARVTATNWLGISSTTYLPGYWRSTLPMAPGNLAWGTITNTTIDISFGASVPDNSAQTIYIVQVSTASNFSVIAGSSQTVRGTGTKTMTVSNLTPNTTYYARVAARGQDATIVATNLNPARHSTLVSVPQGQVWDVLRGDKYLKVNWDISTPNDNPLKTKYTVQLSTSSDYNPIKSSSVTIHAQKTAIVSGLEITTTYYARVIATNWEGISSTVNVAGSRTTLQSAPDNLAWGTITNTSIEVTWGASSPENPSNTPYRLVISSMSNFSVVHTSNTTRGTGTYGATITGLTPNTTYYAKVISIWSGQFSTAAVSGWRSTLANTPGDPVVSVASWNATDGYNLKVTINANGNPRQTEYLVLRLDGGTTAQMWTLHDNLDIFTNTGLTPNTQYQYKVKARNRNHIQTAYSNVVSSFTAPSQVPLIKQIGLSETAITWQWGIVSETVRYNVYNASNYSLLTTKLGYGTTTWDQTGLVPNSQHLVYVKAQNEYGEGQYSATLSTFTFAAVPGTPAFSNVVYSTHNVYLTFTEQGNSNITEYLIRCLANNATYYVQVNGKLGAGKQWSSYSDWGAGTNHGNGTIGVNVNSLEAATVYNFSVKARNAYYNETNYSVANSTITLFRLPELSVLAVSTNTVTFIIDKHENPKTASYAVRVTPEGESARYVQPNGTLGASEVWKGTGTWGGYMVDGSVVTGNGFTVRVSTPANRRYLLELSAKDVVGNVYNNYLTWASTYTLAIVPQLSIIQVSSNTITVNFDEVYNSTHTRYGLKLVLQNGTTGYALQNHSFGSTLTFQTTAQWQTGRVTSLIPNMGYYIRAIARNDTDRVTSYSASVSTWTFLTRPPAPSLSAGWSQALNSYIRITINNPNSDYTKYAIAEKISNVLYYLNDAGLVVQDLNGDMAEATWHTKAEWESGNKNELISLGSNEQHILRVIPYSLVHAPGTGLALHSPDSTIITPKTAPNTPVAYEHNDDVVRVTVQDTPDTGGFAIYASTTPVRYQALNYIGSTLNLLSQSPVTYSYDYDIDGSSPMSINTLVINPDFDRLTFTWDKLPNPDASPAAYFCAANITSQGDIGQQSDKQQVAVSVTPVIKSYTVYLATYTATVLSTATADAAGLTYRYSYTGLQPNTLYSYRIVGRSTDDLESNDIVHSTYTLANRVNAVLSDAQWSAANKFHNTLSFGHNGNPANTQYAVRVTKPNDPIPVWLNASGTESAAAVWQTANNWQHIQLLNGETYTYDIYSRNFAGVVTSSATQVSITTLAIRTPETSGIVCRYSKDDMRRVKDNVPANSTSPYFSWGVEYSSFTVLGYSYLWSTDPDALPDDTVDTTNTFYNPTITYSDGEIVRYYFSVKFKDAENQWSSVKSFIYYFYDDQTKPSISAVSAQNGISYKGTYYGVPLNALLTIVFDEDVSTETLTTDNVYIESLCNELEESYKRRVTPVLNYDQATKTLSINATLSSNRVYEIVITTSVLDLVWNPLTSEYRQRFRSIISKDIMTTNKVRSVKTSNIEALVSFPAGSLTNDAYLLINNDPTDSPDRVVRKVFDDAGNKINPKNRPNWYIEVNMYDSTHQLVSGNFASPVLLTMSYQDDDNNGIVDGTTIRVDSLSIWWLNETKYVWSKVPSIVNSKDKTVTAAVSHFSVYGLFGAINLSVADVIVAPVPWVPEDGKAETGTLADGITFLNVPQQGAIRIYTISGELVRKIELIDFTDPSGKKWDGKNETGEYVASGVYLWVVTSDEGKKTGKLIVVR